MGLNVYVVGER